MTLLEMFDYIPNSECLNWYIYETIDDLTVELVATYDGKNSIDTQYNDRTIESATKTDEYILVILKEE